VRLFRNTFLRHGKRWTAAAWTVEFKDHGKKGPRHTRRIVTVADRAAAEAMGRKLQQLADRQLAGLPPDGPAIKWLASLPGNIIRRLVEWNILEPTHAERLTPVREHLETWRQWLEGRGRARKYVRLSYTQVKTILDQIGAVSVADLKPLSLEQLLAGWRDRDGLSPGTTDHYTQSIKAFTRWMLRHGLATTDPLATFGKLYDKVDIRCRRRAVSVAELQRLLRVTREGPVVLGLTGAERAQLYRFAVETGLRASEIRALTVGSFDLDAATLTLRAGETKRRRETVVPLAPATVTWLRPVLARRPKRQRALRVPDKTAKMLRFDLEAAGIPFKDDQGRRFDFHALRGQLSTLLAQAGTHPSVAQAAMRHSTITLTMDKYTHTEAAAVREALASLPDLAG
jgi:integrase